MRKGLGGGAWLVGSRQCAERYAKGEQKTLSPPQNFPPESARGGEQTSEEEEKIPGTAPRSSSQGEEEGEEESLSNH